MIPSLFGDEVQVWSVPLHVGPSRLEKLSRVLADDERQRAGRYAHGPSREQFVVSRAVLRLLLSHYLGIPPAAVRLGVSPEGKPRLPGGELHFNVSHTHGLALCAITRRGEIGVDVERVRPCPTHLDMAARFFTPGEAGRIHTQPCGHSEEAFFHVWTRKEAFLKALGLGLSHGLERFEVSVPPDDPPRILHIDGDARAGAAWSLVSLLPAPGYVAALASQGPSPRVRVEVWQDDRLYGQLGEPRSPSHSFSRPSPSSIDTHGA
jgi:4'-phosphopantetheinyl transferase